MAIELEGLEFQINAKSESAHKNVEALANSLGKLKNATRGFRGLDDVSGKLGKLNGALASFHSEKLEKLSNSLQALNNASNVKISASIPKRISDIAAASKQLNDADLSRLEKLGEALQAIGAAGNVRMPNLQMPNSSVSTPTNPAIPATSDVATASSQIQTLNSELSHATGLSNGLKSILSGIGNVLGKGFNVGVEALKRLGSAIGSAASKAKTLNKNAVALPFVFGSKLAAKVKQTTFAFKNFYSSLKRIAMYRAIRSIIAAITQGFQEGISNLYQYSSMMGGTFAESMDKLATSSQYLKNSIGAMAAPIINALAPAIDFLIDKIVTLLNHINMLFARLSGATSFTAAKKSAKEFGKAIGGAGGSAKKAAKEIRDATLGIDELNIIMQKDDMGSGGGSGGADYGSMFEELPIDKNISKFADRLKEVFENADWKTLGTLLGGKANEVVDNVNWSKLGRKIGFAINGAVQTAYWFLDTVDFKNIGARFAELTNTAMEEIDFSFVGRLAVKPFTSLIDIIIGYLGELDWGLVAKSLSDYLSGAYDEATKWLNKYDWSKVGKTLWKKIKDVFANIDYEKLAKSFFTYLGTAIRSTAQFLGGFFGSIADDIKTWWNEDIEGTDWKETTDNLFKAIKKGCDNIDTWVDKNIISPFGQALLGESWDDVKQVGAKLLAKIKNGWDTSSQLEENKGQFLVKVKNDSSKWWSKVKIWWSGKVGAVQSFTTSVANHASQWWSNVQEWWSGKVGAVQSFTTQVIDQSDVWWSNVKTWWSGKVGAVQSFTVGVVNSASTWWSNVQHWWSKVVGTLWTTLNIKLPHVRVSWNKDPIFGKIDVPSFKVEWYANGGILDGAQLFGRMGNAFLGGGEAGKEAVLPLERHTEWMDTLANKVREGLPDEDDKGSTSGIKQVLNHLEALEVSIGRMAADMKRQADKPENTTVQIGNKTITDAVITQQRADGYRFAR